jgi:hypothetical protein
MSLQTLRVLVGELKVAHAEAEAAAGALLACERKAQNSIDDLHKALSVFGAALQRATTVQRELARVLALDPDKLVADEPLVPPMVEGTAEVTHD